MTCEMKMEDMLPLILDSLNSKGNFIFFPKGISMLPTIVQLEDRVKLINPENIKKYHIALYRRNDGHFVLHRVVRVHKNGTFTMSGDNQLSLEHDIKKEQIIALVSEIIHSNGKTVSCTGINNSIYGFFIRAYRFSQRCTRALRRRVKFLNNVY